MKLCLILPFLLQGLAMMADEFLIHHRRGLPKWERIGHPLDTLTLILCFGWICAKNPSPEHQDAFILLAAFSSLFVTKDEFVHARVCEPLEHWLHAVLFLLHPIVLIASYAIWLDGKDLRVLQWQLFILILFALYQIIYWSWIWQPKSKSTNSRTIPLTPPFMTLSESAGTPPRTIL